MRTTIGRDVLNNRPLLAGVAAAGVAAAVALAILIGSSLTVSVLGPSNTAHMLTSVSAELQVAEEQAIAEAKARANLYGIQASAYTGSYFNSGHESTRMCIVGKESGGNYRIVSSNGLWHGAYQFTIGTSNNAAQMMGRSDLVGTPASQWTRAEQDQAFWTTWNHGAGRGHWPTAYGC